MKYYTHTHTRHCILYTCRPTFSSPHPPLRKKNERENDVGGFNESRERERERTLVRKEESDREGRDGQTERHQKRERERDALRIKGAEMSTEREKKEREGGRATDRQTDSEALKFMAFFIFRAENQYCLLWMR